MRSRNLAVGFYQDMEIAKEVIAHLRKKGFFRFALMDHSQVYRYFPMSWKRVKRFRNRVIQGELLLLVEVSQEHVRDVLALLRNVKTSHSVTFLLRPQLFEESLVEITFEGISLENMCQKAQELARSLREYQVGELSNQSLLQQFSCDDERLQFLRRDIADAEFIEQTLPSPAEWLLDNMYLIEGAIEDIKLNLPKQYYKELPKILKGPLAQLPRIYALACELMKLTAGQLTKDAMIQFLQSYQKIDPLTIGELWAFPMMLRLRLIEWVEFLIIRVDNRMREGELAHFWGNRLLTASRYAKDKVEDFLIDLASSESSFSGHFAEELLDHLFDEESVLPKVQKWLEEQFKMPLEEILHQEHLSESQEHIVFSDCIKSLIVLGQLSWTEIFEEVSLVDAILKQDPAQIYSSMDFETRNSYRKVIEKRARKEKIEEVKVAENLLFLANQSHQHIGYYLIDGSRKYAGLVYIGGIFLATGIGVALSWSGFVFLLLALIPLSEIAVQVLNFLLAYIFPPHLLPRMCYKKGIPEQCKTLVVVPMVLTDRATIREAIEHLEVRYLANSDPKISFSLFSDYKDAKNKNEESDASLLEYALNGIRKLESLYGEGKFFLFHRDRVFSKSEEGWIGWERKRGKIEALNRYLLGDVHENILYAGKQEALKNIKYVITLDSDTRLPKDQARGLIELISHPLNRYAIIQPRVATDFLEGKATRFSKLFAEPEAVDPYTQAISNVYQDFAKEGIYHGKGIYDVNAFHKAIKGKFPEEHILSHDLIEGAFAHTGFASTICLYDSFPKTFQGWIKRQNRWIRGDLQIIDWLLPKVPTQDGTKVANPLSWLNRWKIFDNVRRALLPISLFLLFLYGSVILPLIVMAFPLKKMFLRIMLLPFEAYNSTDALIRVVFRRLISKRNLLQWNTGKELTLPLGWIALISFGLSLYFGHLVLACLWLSSYFLIHFLNEPLATSLKEDLKEEDQLLLRRIARKTWRYFDELSTIKTHFLPPDNYQTELNIEIADRTSPTNIGMGILAPLNARDFNFITVDRLIDQTYAALQELKKLERFHGHFLNWYRLQELQPLSPRYVSTVDSGNLLVSFWTLKQGMEEIALSPVLPADAFAGLQTILELIIENRREIPIKIPPHFSDLQDFYQILHSLLTLELQEHYWETQLKEEILAWNSLFTRYFGWVNFLNACPPSLGSEALELRRQALTWSPSLKTLGEGKRFFALERLISLSLQSDQMEIKVWGKALLEALERAEWFAGEKLGLIRSIIQECEEFSQEMDFKFLYNKERKLFTIGYNVDEKRQDSSHYDLLASEARLTSIVAIAKEDVPLEHWWALGRVYSQVQKHTVLLSWGGTMFEYLMPLIFNQQDADSLLGAACLDAVNVQIAYGKQRGIPWGISESAYSTIDSYKIYQYRSFGVPGLGIKRGLEEDLVISPYSTVLALVVNPKAALNNIKEMIGLNLLGPYGFYDALDFTRQKSPVGERGVLVAVYMAHHQGMIFSTLNNFLKSNCLIQRFHRDPRIAGVQSLLYERIPKAPPIKTGSKRREPAIRKLIPFSETPFIAHSEGLESPIPKVNLLSNGKYSLMITNAGGGYSRFNELDITRWQADTTQDNWGSFLYIKDLDSNQIWSATFQPTCITDTHYSVKFKADKAEFRRKDHEIELVTEIGVSPEDQAEIRLLTFINHSSEIRHLEVTSYAEVVLAPHEADKAHPCFSKLFIEMEALPSALLATRREKPIFAVHVVSEEGAQFETDRGRFIGRGNTLAFPESLKGDLSNSQSHSLDPIFSLRIKVTLEPGRREQVAFVTAIGDSRENAFALIEKYRTLSASTRTIEHAWNFAQLELRHLKIEQEEVLLFQQLASYLIYPHQQLRTTEERLIKNQLGTSGLWAQGISGDLPILAILVGDVYDIDLVKQLLIAREFLFLRGLKFDLVILNEEGVGYEQPIQESLQKLMNAYSSSLVYLKNTPQLSTEEFNVILAAAHVVLVASRGSLRQQMIQAKAPLAMPSKLKINPQVKEELSEPLPFLELPYFNGLGGYTQDGKTYVIYLGPNVKTPAPWINVIANEQFGTLVSESGIGCSWYGNSQTNRLTEWSNDPLLDPITDVVYVRDEELGTFWTITPSPIRELDAYRIWHGQGYTRFEHHSHGIVQDLFVFVSPDKPIRAQKVCLANHSSRKRILTLTAYSEWVLGKDKEKEQRHLITEWDQKNSILFAYNRFNIDFGNKIAFTSSTAPIVSYTADRTEFIGRNSTLKNPAALKRTHLTGRVGAGLDPCSALQVKVEIDPGQKVEVSFFLGYAEDRESIKGIHLEDTLSFWDQTLETIQVEIPDLATQFALNRFLLYQTISCRFFARAAFYQSSGAYGFRDQLQDAMAILYVLPEKARAHILKAASRQYVEGDVQHWWHPQTGAGVRTRCSDDLLWLPFVTSHYLKVTQDLSILEELIPFIEGDLLLEGQDESYQIPLKSKESATLLEHCKRAIQKGTTAGPHGLPFIGSCDWNDGFSRVKGESVWLAWFLAIVLSEFKEEEKAKELVKTIEKTSWDGAWYIRAFFADGTPIGSKHSEEAYIDSLSQSWSVISGLGNKERCKRALQSAYDNLVKEKERLVLLLTPPFNHITHDPGYIKAYPPGIRENGGQYTHGSAWLPMAFARSGDPERATQLLRFLAPTSHTQTPEENQIYKVEPYVIAADIYSHPDHLGRGGWTWYTGSSAWIYRIWLEEILGFKLEGNRLTLKGSIPKEWPQYKIRYRYKSSTYVITVKNPHHLTWGPLEITVDGNKAETIILQDDGKEHQVEVLITPETR